MVGKLQENERLGQVDDEGFILAQRPPGDTGVEDHRRVPIVVFRRDPETSKISWTILLNKGSEQSEFWGIPGRPRGVYHHPEFIKEDGLGIVWKFSMSV